MTFLYILPPNVAETMGFGEEDVLTPERLENIVNEEFQLMVRGTDLYRVRVSQDALHELLERIDSPTPTDKMYHRKRPDYGADAWLSKICRRTA